MFAVVSKSDRRYRVLVDADKAHALSVLRDLVADEKVPSDLRLKRVRRG